MTTWLYYLSAKVFLSLWGTGHQGLRQKSQALLGLRCQRAEFKATGATEMEKEIPEKRDPERERAPEICIWI